MFKNENLKIFWQIIFDQTVTEVISKFKSFYYEELLQLEINIINTFQIVHLYLYHLYLFGDLWIWISCHEIVIFVYDRDHGIANVILIDPYHLFFDYINNVVIPVK